jgi:hypothetical protein
VSILLCYCCGELSGSFYDLADLWILGYPCSDYNGLTSPQAMAIFGSLQKMFQKANG